jgi:hypothetical protein
MSKSSQQLVKNSPGSEQKLIILVDFRGRKVMTRLRQIPTRRSGTDQIQEHEDGFHYHGNTFFDLQLAIHEAEWDNRHAAHAQIVVKTLRGQCYAVALSTGSGYNGGHGYPADT